MMKKIILENFKNILAIFQNNVGEPFYFFHNCNLVRPTKLCCWQIFHERHGCHEKRRWTSCDDIFSGDAWWQWWQQRSYKERCFGLSERSVGRHGIECSTISISIEHKQGGWISSYVVHISPKLAWICFLCALVFLRF